MSRPPRYLRPTADPADRAILTGDPGRALALAQDLIAKPPPMFNHHRGLWGYSGPAVADGLPLIVQGAGLGAASHLAVIEDLASLGVDRIVRVGSCSSLGRLKAGDVLVAKSASGADGVTAALGGGTLLEPDARITAALSGAGTATVIGTVHSSDRPSEVTAADCDVTDLATASVLAAARHLGIRAAAILVVARDAGSELADSDLESQFRAIAATAALALEA